MKYKDNTFILTFRMNNGDISPPVMDLQQHPPRAQSLHRQMPPYNNRGSAPDFTPLTPVSRIQIGGSTQPDRPLDRPTLVRPNRMNSQDHVQQSSPQPQMPPQQYYQTTDPNMYQKQTRAKESDIAHFGTPKNGTSNSSNNMQQHLPEQEKVEVVPMNADKPCGLELDDFLPKKFQGLSMTTSPYDASHHRLQHSPSEENGSRFSNYKNYQTTELSEQEVTSSILKGHESMMAVLTTRGRNIEIIHKLWQNKDAKAGKKILIFVTFHI